MFFIFQKTKMNKSTVNINNLKLKVQFLPFYFTQKMKKKKDLEPIQLLFLSSSSRCHVHEFSFRCFFPLAKSILQVISIMNSFVKFNEN